MLKEKASELTLAHTEALREPFDAFLFSIESALCDKR